MIAINFLGPIRVINAFIDHLKTRQGAVIVNVSSGLAYVPYAPSPTYNATKAAIHWTWRSQAT
ncbi:SDR family NAD(P)-dependent oxidoreductase [Pseudomonas sp. DSP3-2-2]|uniref:SDR family NAD(P)-dependent oxidoreductase n=1 Tax=unclassified Pseudomonas TaxID=196821 RepID=UPI003CF6A7EE